MKKTLKALIIGCGNMGRSHAKAYAAIEGIEICGLVSRGDSKNKLRDELKQDIPLFDDLDQALAESTPDIACISTYPDTHEEYSIKAMEAGCHVFLEKPVATTLEGCQRVLLKAKHLNRKLAIGYILRHHPSWISFVQKAKTLGKPLVMRMNLNQQSQGDMWTTHKNLMKSMPPIVDCGVHYIDVMCQMTEARPVRVNAIGVKLSDEIAPDMTNYGQLQVVFDDGSVGWYEAGWGPMMSQTAFFVKDVVGPKGSVSIVAQNASKEGQSDNVEAHTKTESLRIHHSDIDAQQNFTKEDEWIQHDEEPDHDGLCQLEQEFLVRAIHEDINLDAHHQQALDSLRVVLAAQESIQQQRSIELES